MATAISPRVERAWQRLANHPLCQVSRNTLVEHYLSLVEINAQKLAARLPESIDPQDLVQAGVFGLMDAIRKFEPERGLKFETYCVPRIRGAMLDYIRASDWVPRLVRSNASKIKVATNELWRELGREPTTAELATRFQLSIEGYERYAAQAEAQGVESLSRLCYQGSGSLHPREKSLGDLTEDLNAEIPHKRQQNRDALRLVTKGLNKTERLLIIGYYYEEMTMKEIGEMLELSESRVSQLHSELLARLKRQLAGRRHELAAA